MVNAVVTFSILLAIILYIYFSVGMTIVQNTDAELMSSAYQMKRFVNLMGNEPVSLLDDELNKDYVYLTERLEKSMLSFCVWDGNNTIVESQKNFNYEDEVLNKCREALFADDTMSVNTLDEPDGIYYIHEYHYNDTNIRVCSTILSDDKGDLRVIQLVGNMNEKNAFNEKLFNSLTVSAFFGVCISFLCGYFIAGRSMIPIENNMNKQKEFVADASHELRTPITILRTNLDLVMSSPEEDVGSQLPWLENAYKETERMEKLITDLLFLARTDLKQTDIEFTKTDISELLNEIVLSVSPAASEQNIGISLITENTPLYIFADKSKIEQLMLIILDNALQYTPDGGSITVSAGSYNGMVNVSVTDTGIGISEEDIDKIFDRFYRADKARSRRQGGTGLGLSIAKFIVEAHKGTISARSTLGNGTVIEIGFPIYEEGV